MASVAKIKQVARMDGGEITCRLRQAMRKRLERRALQRSKLDVRAGMIEVAGAWDALGPSDPEYQAAVAEVARGNHYDYIVMSGQLGAETLFNGIGKFRNVCVKAGAALIRTDSSGMPIAWHAFDGKSIEINREYSLESDSFV